MNMSEMMPRSPKVILVTEKLAQRKMVSSVSETTATCKLLIFCFWSYTIWGMYCASRGSNAQIRNAQHWDTSTVLMLS